MGDILQFVATSDNVGDVYQSGGVAVGLEDTTVWTDMLAARVTNSSQSVVQVRRMCTLIGARPIFLHSHWCTPHFPAFSMVLANA